MSQIHKLVLSSVILVIVVLFSANQTNADPVTLTLTDPVQTGTIGSTLLFTGVLTNTGTEPVLINTSGLIVDPFTTAVNMIFSSGPLTLGPMQTTGLIPLFTVTIDPTIPAPSTIIGFFSVGRDSSTEDLAIQEFSINVEAIPEPATLILLGTGLAAITLRARRKSV